MNTDGLKIGLFGASGRMGGALARAVAAQPGLRLSVAVAPDGDGRPLGALHGVPGLELPVSPRLEAQHEFDVLIDFSRPEGTMQALDACRARGAALVTGTTGLDESQQQRLREAAAAIAVCQASNFSIGVNVVLALLAQAGRLLDADYDVEVVEAHHRHKVDAPSGTALSLGEAVARARGVSLPRDGVFSRHGHTGARVRGSIGFSTIRGGDIVGEHRVLFAGDGERIEIAHLASSRDNFASGALRAARWLHGRAPGWYTMAEVLGIAAP